MADTDDDLTAHMASVVFDQMGQFRVEAGELRDQIRAALEVAYMAGYDLGVGDETPVPCPRTPNAWGDTDLGALPLAAFPDVIPPEVWKRSASHLRGTEREELALVSADAAAEGDPVGVANSRQIYNLPYLVAGRYRMSNYHPAWLLKRKLQNVPVVTVCVQNVAIDHEQHLTFLSQEGLRAALRRLHGACDFSGRLAEPSAGHPVERATKGQRTTALPIWSLHGGDRSRIYGHFAVGELSTLVVGGWTHRSFFVQMFPLDLTPHSKDMVVVRGRTLRELERTRETCREYWTRRLT